jgi:hypothetical protein
VRAHQVWSHNLHYSLFYTVHYILTIVY